MKKKLLAALAIENRAISESTNVTNKTMVISLLTLFSVIDGAYDGDRTNLIYCGDNPITFLMLFIAGYLFGYKVIKVSSKEQLQDTILSTFNPVVFTDPTMYTDELFALARLKDFILFNTYNVKFNLVVTISNYAGTFDYIKRQTESYKKESHEALITRLTNCANPMFIEDLIVLELPSSGIHSPEKHIGFSKENIDSIVQVISRLPGLLNHDSIRIFSTIESSFFYMLSGYVNQKTLLTNVNARGNLATQLYSQKQLTLIDGNHLMYLWNVLLKEIICNNTYRFFNRKYLRWIVGLRVRSLLRSFLGRSLKSLYIINADIPYDLKQLLRNSFLKVGFLYGIRETGNIIGSNFKKDKISLHSYKIENAGYAINVDEDLKTGILFVDGDAVADSIQREYNSNASKEEDLVVNTHDIASVNGDTITFLSPVGTALSVKDHLNFDLYFAERTLMLLPELLHVLSFEYQNDWYIGVQVDEAYLDKTNINLEDVTMKLNGIKSRINTYLPQENIIRGIEISTRELLLNNEGVPVRFIHKLANM